jgi:hypothetical protein
MHFVFLEVYGLVHQLFLHSCSSVWLLSSVVRFLNRCVVRVMFNMRGSWRLTHRSKLLQLFSFYNFLFNFVIEANNTSSFLSGVHDVEIVFLNRSSLIQSLFRNRLTLLQLLLVSNCSNLLVGEEFNVFLIYFSKQFMAFV